MFEVSVAEFKAAQAATNWSAGDLVRENTAAGSLPLQGIVLRGCGLFIRSG
jgi:hypothetical protein